MLALQLNVGHTCQSQEAVWASFIARVRDNLHIVLTMSPVGDAFRNRQAVHYCHWRPCMPVLQKTAKMALLGRILTELQPPINSMYACF